ncbi:MAG TPA: hypothetical protein PK264_18790, partial [Hyphomicrobiaceae bacterium]|nr:hypothetical protein [Hyphomicrobiaceae bacterium]
MSLPRRSVLALGIGAGAAPLLASAADATPGGRRIATVPHGPVIDAGLAPNAEHDQAPALQALIDRLTPHGGRIWIAAGAYRLSRITLR